MAKQVMVQRAILGLMLALLALAGIAIALPRAEAFGIGSPAVGPPMPQTNVGGPIISDTTWAAAGSPYVITTSVYVSPGVTLTVEPGVEVRFNDNLSLVVSGTLSARGTASQPITLTTSRASPSPGSWAFIKFTDPSIDATFDGAGNYSGGSILQYATVQYAGSTGNGALWLDYASPFIDHCTIRQNNKSGIYAYYSSGLRITNNTIANNTASAYDGGGISAWYGTVTISGNTIANNTSSRYGGGINAWYGTATISGNTIANNSSWDGGGIMASGTVTIAANTIAGNSAYQGGGIYAHTGTVTITGNTIANNHASWSGGAIYAYGYVTVIISCNTIANNTAVNYPGCAGGIYANFYVTVIISGTNFFANYPYAVYNGWSEPIVATHNWWNTTVTATIGAIIRGSVTYIPFLTAPATCAPPSPPTGLAATPGVGSIALSWTANPEADIAGYRVYYDTDSGFPYANAITAGNTTAYTFTSLSPGITYYLAVTAYDTGGDESWYSAQVLAIPVLGAVLSLRVSFQGGTGSGTARWVNVVTTTLTGTTPSDGTYIVTTTNTGTYTLTDIVPATYTVVVVSPHTLANRRTGVVVTPAMDVVNMCTLREGNANMDAQVNIADFDILAASYLKMTGQPGFNPMADFDKSGQVNMSDFGLLAGNYLRTGPVTCP